MEIKGKVFANLGIQKGVSKAGKEWEKATIVIETEGVYPQKVAIDNIRNAQEFGKLQPGMSAVFQIELSSNEFNGKWYTNVTCWQWQITQCQV